MFFYRKAGKFLARLHALPHEDTDVPLDEAFHARLSAWSRRAEGVVETADIEWVARRVLEGLPALRGLQRVPCHRDYHARNWVLDGNDFHVIDFEHSRPDLFLMDVHKMWSQQWRTDRPILEDAFWDGYGRSLTEDEQQLLERFSALAALCTIAWSREHGDREFENHGQQMIRWLQARSRT